MKKFILLVVFIVAGVSISQTQDVMTVKLKDGTLHEFKVEEVGEVTFGSSEISPSCPVAEAIDLGLPSGTKWASWNVGASKPEEYGGYYAWGETEEKDYYDWSTYTHCDGSGESCHHIGDDIAGTEYDVAHVKWGSSWRMPTKAQRDELKENCTREWTQLNGVNGTLVTGLNGNTIFLPAAGYCDLFGLSRYAGSVGYYWLSSHYSSYYERHSYSLYFTSSGGWYSIFSDDRDKGFSVRAVCP